MPNYWNNQMQYPNWSVAPSYQPAAPQYNQAFAMPQPNSMNSGINLNQSSIIWVQGEAGAKAYNVPAGSTVLLMDSETPRFYIKSTSANGIPMKLRMFDYSEILDQSQSYQTVQDSIPAQSGAMPEFATKEDLSELRKLIEERLPERRENRQKDSHAKPAV